MVISNAIAQIKVPLLNAMMAAETVRFGCQKTPTKAPNAKLEAHPNIP